MILPVGEERKVLECQHCKAGRGATKELGSLVSQIMEGTPLSLLHYLLRKSLTGCLLWSPFSRPTPCQGALRHSYTYVRQPGSLCLPCFHMGGGGSPTDSDLISHVVLQLLTLF